LALKKTDDGYSYEDTFFGIPTTVFLNIKQDRLFSTVFLFNLNDHYAYEERKKLTTKVAEKLGFLFYDEYKKDCRSPITLTDWIYYFLGNRYHSVRWLSYKKDETIFVRWNRAYKNIEVGMSKAVGF